jgi:MmpS family membrane protein
MRLRAEGSHAVQALPPGGVPPRYIALALNSRNVSGEETRLPLSSDVLTSLPAIVGNIATQGDRDSIGCSNWVESELKAEQIPNEFNAFNLCPLTAR